MTTETQAEPGTTPDQLLIDVDGSVRVEMLQDGYDLPELAETMEEADARASASPYLWALGQVEQETAANDAEYKTLQVFCADRHAERQTTLGVRAAYLRQILLGLFNFMRPHGKKKSLNLLGGRVGTRAKQDELVVDDDAVVIAWAKEHNIAGLVTMKPQLNRKGLREYLDAIRPDADNFPTPPGARLKTLPDEFYVKPAVPGVS